MAKTPPLPKLGGKKGGKNSLPPLPGGIGGSSGQTKSKSNATRIVTTMLKQHGYPSQYARLIIEYAQAYGIDPAIVTSVLLTETNGKNPAVVNGKGARGLGQILDTKLGNYNNSTPLGWVSAPGHASYLQPGQQITNAMKNSPQFAIAYVAWRMAGTVGRLGWPGAYTASGGYNPGGPTPVQIPSWYTPTTQYAGGGGVDKQLLKNISTSTITTKSDPFIVYKGGKISYSWSLTNDVLQYDGVPVTKSLLQQQVQDKAGIGGDYYNFTGQSPNPIVVAKIMASGRNLQQIENQWIGDVKHFKDSPAGKKYFAGYQDAWSQVMGKNQAVPWELVQEAARSNLNESEFAAKLRMDGFQGQKQNNQWSYLNSNEYQSRVDAYTLSYQKIYGEHLTDPGFKSLASDAALAGWDPTQWEAYLRSLPQYTHTAEYQGHALGLLNKLGMDFGMEFGLGAGGYTPASGADELPGPPGDKRVGGGAQATPGPTDNNLGITVTQA